MKELWLNKWEILWKTICQNFNVALGKATARSNVLLLFGALLTDLSKAFVSRMKY